MKNLVISDAFAGDLLILIRWRQGLIGFTEFREYADSHGYVNQSFAMIEADICDKIKTLYVKEVQ